MYGGRALGVGNKSGRRNYALAFVRIQMETNQLNKNALLIPL